MGRLLNEKEIINKNIQSYLEKSTSEYSRFLETTPSFVTYYNKAIIHSTIDEGLEDTHNYIGEASSRKYKKINNFPMYGIETIPLELSREDFGANTSYDGNGIVLPATIKPLPQDYFSISYIGQLYLFRVNSVINDKLNGKNFYKIEFSFNKILESSDELEAQITGEYDTIFNNIGTTEKCVIEQSEKAVVDHIEKLEEKLIDFYNENFLDKRFNLHLYKFMKYNFYNQMATNFILDNKVMSRQREYNNSTYVIDVLKKNNKYHSLYRESLYYALEKQDHSKLEAGYRNSLLPIEEKHTPFSLYPEHYVNIIPLKRKVQPRNIDDIEFPFYDDEFIINIKNFILYEEHLVKDKIKLFENLIIRFLNKETLTEGDLDDIDEYPYQPSYRDFFFVPIIIFILKANKKDLLSKINL